VSTPDRKVGVALAAPVTARKTGNAHDSDATAYETPNRNMER
jgi:hypothetical protein